MTDKQALRSEMRARRKALALAAPDAADRLAGFADDLPGAVVHALYLPIGAEIDPRPLAARLAYEGYDLCLPVVTAPATPLIFRWWRPGDDLAPDASGIPAPLPSAREMQPELILTPLLAFDGSGGRLGQGGGYYDRTFAARPEALRVGVAYAGQRVERLTLLDHDIPLHGVLTETGYTAFP